MSFRRPVGFPIGLWRSLPNNPYDSAHVRLPEHNGRQVFVLQAVSIRQMYSYGLWQKMGPLWLDPVRWLRIRIGTSVIDICP